MKRKGTSNQLKAEILNYLADSLSFAKTDQRFPAVSLDEIRNILRESAQQCEQEQGIAHSYPGTEFLLYTDGASRGNPGKAGAGSVVLDSEGQIVDESKKYLGKNTNNAAEYRALIHGLGQVLKAGGRRVHVFSDSELMVKQLKGTYKVRNKELILLHKEVNDLLKKFTSYDIKHINREQNRHADRLANEAIDQRIP